MLKMTCRIAPRYDSRNVVQNAGAWGDGLNVIDGLGGYP